MVQEREPGWRGDELAHWPDALSVQSSLLPSCTAPSPLLFLFLNLTFSHPRGLKIVGLCIGMDSDRLKRM